MIKADLLACAVKQVSRQTGKPAIGRKAEQCQEQLESFMYVVFPKAPNVLFQ